MRERGFTLIEMMMAVAVLTLGSFSILSLYVTTVAGLKASQEISRATELAQEKMEELTSAEYLAIVPGTYPPEEYGQIAGHPDFSRLVEVREDLPSAGMKKITVTTRWKGSVGLAEREFVLETILTEEGAN